MAPGAVLRAGLVAAAFAVAAAGCVSPGAGRDAATSAGVAARLVPDPAFATARIAVVIGEASPDPGAFRFEWRRNGALLDGATGAELDPSRFSRGDRISVRLVPADPGSGPLAAEVRVVNSPPRVSRVSIVMETAAAGSELRALAECADPDGDRPALEFAWSRNGEPATGAAGATLPAAAFARGDRITVSVVARDDEAASAPVCAEPFVFENHAPAFTSRPAAPRPGDAVFRYEAVAVDPDGDPLRYELAGAPAGMTVDARGGVSWELPAGALRRGEHAVRLRATDPLGGEAVQEFTIRL